MRVLIDGRYLSDKSTGLRKYTEVLIHSYVKEYGSSNVFVIVKNPIDSEDFISIVYNKKAYSLWNFVFFHNFIKQLKVDLFHSPAHYNSFFKVRKCVYVTTIHDIMYKMVPSFYRRNKLLNILGVLKTDFFIRQSLLNSDFVISISECTKQDILRVFGSKSKVYPNGINKFATSSVSTSIILDRLALCKEGYFLYVGLTMHHKNVQFLIDCFLRAKTDKMLVICGNNNGNLKCSNNRVLFLGYVDNASLAILYKNCSAFVFPSLYEGFGLPVLEALSLGAKVFCSTGGALREFSPDVVSFFNPKDPVELIYLMENSDLIVFKKQVVSDYLGLFDWDKSMHLMHEEIKQILINRK